MRLSLFSKNMEALRQYRPQLLPVIDRVRSVRAIRDTDETRKNAKDAVAFLGDIAKEGVFVIMGVGAGYFVEQLSKKVTDGHSVIIYEPEVGVFKSLLSRADVSSFLSSEKAYLVVGDKPDCWFVHHCHHNMVNGKLWVIRHKNFTNGGAEKCDEFYQKFLAEKRAADVNVGTLVGLGKTFMNSILKNMPKIVQSQGINELRGLLSGIPAVVVASGPSIDNQIDDLKRMQGHVALLAVDTALPFLLSRDIVPTAVFGIDPLDDNKSLVTDPLCKDIPLVCLTQYTPDVVKSYLGPIFFSGQPGNQITQWLRWYYEDKGAVDCFGGSVSHFAIGMAHYMGASEIALVGHDYCFKSKWYCGTTSEDMHKFMKLQVPDETQGADKDTNIDGEEVFTRPILQTFKHSVERWIAGHPDMPFVNLSHGLSIEGAEPMSIREYADKYTGLTAPSLPPSPTTPFDPSDLLSAVMVGRGILRKIKKVSLRIISTIHEIKAMREKGDQKAVRRMMNRIERVRKATVHPLLEIMGGYHTILELYLKRQDVQDIDKIEDEHERQGLRLDRGLNYYGELNEALGIFLTNLDPLLKELRKMKRGIKHEKVDCTSVSASSPCIS
jgi:hypothetical protein